MRLSALLPLFLFTSTALTASGCCSWDFEELEEARRPDDRREALACLAEDAQEDPELRKKLVKICTAWVVASVQPDPAVRATALRVLRTLSAGSSAGAIQLAIPGEPTPEVRVEAVTTLAALAGAKAQEPLLARMAADPDPDVRMASARELRGLAQKGKPSAALTEAFIQRLDDAHQGVRLHARRGLCSLYPKVDEGLSATAWRAFLKRRKDGTGGPAKPDPDGPPPVPSDDDDDRPPPVPLEPPKKPAPEDQPPKPEDYPFPEEPLDTPEEPAPPKVKPAPKEPEPAPKEPEPSPKEPKPTPKEPKPTPEKPKGKRAG